MEWRFKVISGDYSPRQFEFRPNTEGWWILAVYLDIFTRLVHFVCTVDVLFGAMNGDVCFASSDENWQVQNLGQYGKIHGDTILGLCWLKKDSNKFFSGSSRGRVLCGDVASLDSSKQMEYPEFEKLTSIHLWALLFPLLSWNFDNETLLFIAEIARMISY